MNLLHHVYINTYFNIIPIFSTLYKTKDYEKDVIRSFSCKFFFSSTTTSAQPTNSNTTTSKNAAAPISGAWRSVDNKEFTIMSDGFFSSVAQDSTGRWAETHAGTYTVDNANTVTLKVTHSSFAYRIGSLHTIEYDLKGDNLTITWFKKLIDAKAGDITAQMPKGTQTQYVRAKL